MVTNNIIMSSVYTIVRIYGRPNYTMKSCHYFFKTKEDAEKTFMEWIASKQKQYKSAQVYNEGDYTVLSISRIGLIMKYKAVEIFGYNIDADEL